MKCVKTHGDGNQVIQTDTRDSMKKENVFILENGDVLQLTKRSAKKEGKVRVGTVFVDGIGVGDVGNIVFNDGEATAVRKMSFEEIQKDGDYHYDKENKRFGQLKQTHPKLYDYCMRGGEYNELGWWQPSKDGLGMKHVLDFIDIKVK